MCDAFLIAPVTLAVNNSSRYSGAGAQSSQCILASTLPYLPWITNVKNVKKASNDAGFCMNVNYCWVFSV